MSYSRGTYHESTWRIAETCPKVDRAASEIEDEMHAAVSKSLADFVQFVKDEATVPLREALCRALDELAEAQKENSEAQDTIARMESDMDYLRSEVKDLTEELRLAREAQYA